MGNQNIVRKEGLIIEALPAGSFRVRVEDGKTYLLHLSGKMRINRIRLIPGDNVIFELPFEDSERGRIVFRK